MEGGDAGRTDAKREAFKMGLQLVVDNLDGLDEAVKALYVERDGKFNLDVDGAPDTSGLKKALDAERTARKEREAELKTLQDKAKSDADKLEQERLKKKGAFDEVIKKREEAWGTEKKEMVEKQEKLDRQLRKYQLDDNIRAAAIAAGVVADDIDDVMTLTASRFDLKDGQPVVLGDDGYPTSGTPKEFFDAYRKAKPKFFEAEGNPGSGAKGGQATSATTNANDMTDPEKSAYIAKHGPDAFKQLPRK